MARAEIGKAALSRREQEVAALVADGLTNRAIAERLFISERTVDGHLEHIREKLGVTSRAKVAAWYVARPAAATPPTVAAPVAGLGQRGRRSFDVLLLAAAALVLALVAGLLVPKLLSPPRSTGPTVISYTGDPIPFNNPLAVALGEDGLFYVADTWNYAIKRIDPKRHTITLVAGGIANGDFVDGGDAFTTAIGLPRGLAVAPGPTVFFANGQCVCRVDPDGTVHLVVAAPLDAPVGVSLGPDGNLYIADLAGNRIWRRSPTGAMTRVAGNGDMGFGGDDASALDAQLNHPVAVAVDAAGDLLIADKGNNRIRRVDAKSGVITTVAGNSEIYGFAGDGGPADHALLSLPLGVAVAPDGDVFISDTGNDRVRRLGKDGTIATVFGAHGELSGPGGLAISASGDLYIADIVDNRIAVLPGAAAG